MRTLILSCNTGAGHNSCALAIQETYHAHGEVCNITDALQFISDKASQFISNWHTRIYLHLPKLFSAGYQSAEAHEDLFREGTPLYKFLSSGAERMYEYILAGGYDNIICTHVFPALALTELRRQHPLLRLTTSHVSTDYTCSPCTADSALDWYFLPAASLTEEFAQCGIPRGKMIASGIPVHSAFYERVSPEVGKVRLGINPSHSHILMMCGSMGCGPMEEIVSCLNERLTGKQELTVVCGTNDELIGKLRKQIGSDPQIHILGRTNNVPQLMKSADLFLTKPGGLSTSEAMAAGLPMVLIDAVAGCEEHNLAFFLNSGTAVTADSPGAIANTALELLSKPSCLSKMRAAMSPPINIIPSETIFKWIAEHAK